MKNRLTRELIHINALNSEQSEANIERALTENVYAEKQAWSKFFHFFLLALGVGFAVSGIIFFFAYNWDDMHKFVKMGIVWTLLTGCIIFVLRAPASETVKNIVLTGAALLVGGLFAVFGQTYQTGADAWQLFFVWTVFIAAWVVAANFAPLWLVFLVLVNATVSLFWLQSLLNDDLLLLDILFCINAGFVIISEVLFLKHKPKQKPEWLLNTVGLCAVAVITFAVVVEIVQWYSKNGVIVILSPLLAVSAFTAGIIRGVKTKTVFYPALISVCIIACFSTLLAEIIDDAVAATLIIGIFIIAAGILSVRNILKLKNRTDGNK